MNQNNKKRNNNNKKNVVAVIAPRINVRPRRARGQRTARGFATPFNYFHKYFAANNDASLEESVHSLLQTSFFPTLGVCRGKANGMEETALMYVKGAVDLVPTATGVGFVLTPANLANFLIYNNALLNPSGTGTATAASPLTATQATAYRYLSASLQIIPTGQPASQGGAIIAGYVSDAASLNWTTPNLEQQHISKNFSANDTVILHSVPNSVEQAMAPVATAPAVTSALWFGITGTNTSSAFRAEYTVVYEYNATQAYMAYVDLKPSDLHPDASYWLSNAAMKSWDPLIVAHYADYADELRQVESMSGLIPLIQSSYAGTSGMGVQSNNFGSKVRQATQNVFGRSRRMLNRLAAPGFGTTARQLGRAGANTYKMYKSISSMFGRGVGNRAIDNRGITSIQDMWDAVDVD